MRLATHFGVIGNDVGKTIDYCHALDIKYLSSGHWAEDLIAFKEQFAKEGITLAMMELGWLKEEMLFGDALQKAELQGFIDRVKRLGDAGIEMGHIFCALKTNGNLVEEWKRITDFYQELGEHAEKNKVKIANHVGWAPEYIIRDQMTFKKFLDAVPNQYIGFNLCLGCLQIVSPADIQQDIDKTLVALGDRLFMINLPLLIDRFIEVSKHTGADPIVLPEHSPKVADERANEIATAYAVGYVKGMLKQKEWMS
jgi:sugar phosphate isomerase/epimerase